MGHTEPLSCTLFKVETSACIMPMGLRLKGNAEIIMGAVVLLDLRVKS